MSHLIFRITFVLLLLISLVICQEDPQIEYKKVADSMLYGFNNVVDKIDKYLALLGKIKPEEPSTYISNNINNNEKVINITVLNFFLMLSKFLLHLITFLKIWFIF